MQPVYVTASAQCLPGAPIPNAEMVDYIGRISPEAERLGNYIGTSVMRADETLPADAEFLRWTLSDGAAWLLIEDRPATHGTSLRIDWISLRSFADRPMRYCSPTAISGVPPTRYNWTKRLAFMSRV